MNLRIASLVALLTLGTGASAMAEDQVKLFKVISPKDDLTIGLTRTVRQYAVRHGKDGSLGMAPLRRVAIFYNDTLRIEPYTTTQPIVAPDK
jgi:hypothetical protein